MSYRLKAQIGSSLLLTAGLLCGTTGCQTAKTVADTPSEQVAQADAEKSEESEESERSKESKESQKAKESEESKRAEARSGRPPEAVALTLEVSSTRLTLDGDELLVLEDGFIGRNDYATRYHFTIKGLLEPVEAALEAKRRRRVVFGEALEPGRLVVEAESGVPADTLIGLQYMLAKTDLKWLTLRVGDAEPMHLRLTRDFTRGRRVSWRRRKFQAKDLDKEIHADLQKKGTLKNIFGSQAGFDTKMNVAMSGEGGDLVVGRGSGGLGLRGVGRGGRGVSGKYCSKEGGEPIEPMAMTHATIKLYPNYFNAWLSEHHDAYPKRMRERFDVDLAKVEGIDSYPWWKLYNTLNRMKYYYGEADSLIVWTHPSLTGEFMAAAARLNCQLPETSYSSQKAWREAREKVESCEPIFGEQVLGNGRHPSPK